MVTTELRDLLRSLWLDDEQYERKQQMSQRNFYSRYMYPAREKQWMGRNWIANDFDKDGAIIDPSMRLPEGF